MTTVMVWDLLSEGTLNRFTAVGPCRDTGLGQHGMRRQSRGLDGQQERPLWEQKLGRALGSICPGPSCYRGGGPPGGEPVLGHTGQNHIWHQRSPLPVPILSLSPPGAPFPALLSHHQDLSSSWRLILQLSLLGKGKQVITGV